MTEPVPSEHTGVYLRERIRGPLVLYAFCDPAGLRSRGLWERDEDPEEVLSSCLLPVSIRGPQGDQHAERPTHRETNTQRDQGGGQTRFTKGLVCPPPSCHRGHNET